MVQNETCLRELSRYIVLSPVRARMVRTANQWHWSSYRATIGATKPKGGLNTDCLLAGFANRKSIAIERYKTFVSEGNNQLSPWENLTNQVFLGSKKFITKIKKHIPKDKDLSEILSSQKRPLAKPLLFYQKKYKNRDRAICEAF